MLMALAALGIDMMLPAFDEMRRSFDLEPGSPRIAQTVTVYFLGMAGAQLLFGPLSDRFGRRPIIFTGIAVYAAGAVGSALAPSLAWLLAFRFVWGVGAASGRTVVMAVVRDSFSGDAMAKMMSTLMAVFLLVPILAPTLGSLIVAVSPWRTIFWASAAIAAALLVWAAARLPETLAVADRQPIRLDVLRSSSRRVFTERRSLVPLLGVTVLTAVFTSYLGSAERIIGEIFDHRGSFALVFGATAAVFGLASLLNGRLVDRFGMRRLMVPCSFLYLAGASVLLMQSIGSDGRPSFWSYMPILALTLGVSMILNPNLVTTALIPLGDIAGTASSLVGAVSLAAGSLVGSFIDRRLDDSVTPFSIALVASGITTVVLIQMLPAIGSPDPSPAPAHSEPTRSSSQTGALS